jgi:hypothetical protein
VIHLVLDEGRPRLLNTWELRAEHEVLLRFERVEDAAEALALALEDARARRLLKGLLNGGRPRAQPSASTPVAERGALPEATPYVSSLPPQRS